MPSFISDEMIKRPVRLFRNLLLSIDILPIPTEEAVREVQSRILGVETDITRWQQRQNRQNNFTATVPHTIWSKCAPNQKRFARRSNRP